MAIGESADHVMRCNESTGRRCRSTERSFDAWNASRSCVSASSVTRCDDPSVRTRLDVYSALSSVEDHQVHGVRTFFLVEVTVMYTENPEITRLFLWVITVESFVLLVAGGGLLFFPSILGPLWPWEVAPFNALLLGSIYSASLVATASV